MLGAGPSSPKRHPSNESEVNMGLSSLPYDLLLNIATFLGLRDVHALHLVSFDHIQFKRKARRCGSIDSVML